MRASVVLVSLVVLGLAWGQTAPPLETYEQFLRELSQLGDGGQRVLQNGVPSPEVLPRPQEVLKLDDASWQRLKEIANESTARSKALDDVERPLVLELRMALAGGEDGSAVRRRIGQIEEQRSRMLQQSLERLRADSTLAQVEAFVAEKAAGSSFFPGVQGVVKGKSK